MGGGWAGKSLLVAAAVGVGVLAVFLKPGGPQVEDLKPEGKLWLDFQVQVNGDEIRIDNKTVKLCGQSPADLKNKQLLGLPEVFLEHNGQERPLGVFAYG